MRPVTPQRLCRQHGSGTTTSTTRSWKAFHYVFGTHPTFQRGVFRYGSIISQEHRSFQCSLLRVLDGAELPSEVICAFALSAFFESRRLHGWDRLTIQANILEHAHTAGPKRSLVISFAVLLFLRLRAVLTAARFCDSLAEAVSTLSCSVC